MQVPLEITWRDMESSPALEAVIRKHAAKLERFHERITSCRVIIRQHAKHKHHGKLYEVHVDITVPGAELAVSREPGKNHAHEDANVAVRDAFRAAVRRLEDTVRRQRGDVKTHETPPHGRIASLFPDRDYGEIESADGRSIYFHRNSVVNEDFDQLEIGMEVRFAEEMGDEGPQASTVTVVGKHHVAG